MSKLDFFKTGMRNGKPIGAPVRSLSMPNLLLHQVFLNSNKCLFLKPTIRFSVLIFLMNNIFNKLFLQ